MNHTFRLFIPALLLVTILIGSVSAPTCPDIPDPPYVPEFPEEDIIKVEAYVITNITSTITQPRITTVAESLRSIGVGGLLHLTLTFAAPTPPADKGILILVTMLQGNPPKEEILGCRTFSPHSFKTQYALDFPIAINGGLPSIAVYASLVEFATDRAPNNGFYQITSLSAFEPNVFLDYEQPVGGVSSPVNKLSILAPYIALAGLIAAISTAYIIRRRKD